MRVPLIYKEKPVFGLDIGGRTVKAVQLKPHGHGANVVGFGVTNFQADAVVEGIISDPEVIAKAIKELLAKPVAGQIGNARAAIALPAGKVFIRTLQLPPMNATDLDQAVRFESEQYVPVPINDLYIDYETIVSPAEKDKEPHIDVLMVAAPRAIVDSYMKLFDFLDLEIDAIETSLSAITRAMIPVASKDKTSLVIDFGSRSADVTIFEQVIRVTGTVPFGGDDLTQTLVKELSVTPDQANEIKYKFGVGASGLQDKIMAALAPQLSILVAEIKKVIKYQKERSENLANFDQVILSGGSASMPGLSDYLAQTLGLPITIGDPWQQLNIGHLNAPSKLEAPMYSTAIGLAMRGLKK